MLPEVKRVQYIRHVFPEFRVRSSAVLSLKANTKYFLSKKWIIRLLPESIIRGNKGLRSDNEDVNWASLMLIKENDVAVVH